MVVKITSVTSWKVIVSEWSQYLFCKEEEHSVLSDSFYSTILAYSVEHCCSGWTRSSYLKCNAKWQLLYDQCLPKILINENVLWSTILTHGQSQTLSLKATSWNVSVDSAADKYSSAVLCGWMFFLCWKKRVNYLSMCVTSRRTTQKWFLNMWLLISYLAPVAVLSWCVCCQSQR